MRHNSDQSNSGAISRTDPGQAGFMTVAAPRFRPACSADEPPRFGFSSAEVRWAWEEFENPAEYSRRLHAVNEVSRRLNGIPPLRSIDFHAGRFLRVIDSLFQSFGCSQQPIRTLEDLSGTKADPESLISRQLLIQRRVSNADAVSPITALPPASRAALDQIALDVARYRAAPPEWKSFLDEDVNLLLMPSLHDPNLVVVTLVPKTPNTPADERYLDFMRRCAENEIPAGMLRPTTAGILGCYRIGSDITDTTPDKVVLFPQLSRPPEADPIEQIRKTMLELSGIKEPLNLAQELEKPLTADEKYRRLLRGLNGGAVSLQRYASEIEEIWSFLKEDQRQALALGLTAYVVSALMRGQLADLNGLAMIPQELRYAICFQPEDANKLRYYYENLGIYSCMSIMAAVDKNGAPTKHALDLEVPQSIKQRQSLTGSELSEIWDCYTELPPGKLRDAMRARVDAFVESKLPANLIKEDGCDVAAEISRFGSLLILMKGQSGIIESQLDPQIAVSVVLFLEHAVGLELTELRAQIKRCNYGAAEALESLQARDSKGLGGLTLKQLPN